MREKYSKVMLKSFIKSYKKVFLFIGVLLIVLFVSFLISGHFEYHEGVNSYRENLGIYEILPVFFINIFLHYIFYMNIALVMCKRNRNFFVAIILSFLTWLGCAIVTESIIHKYILFNIFKLKFSADTFNLLAIYAWRIEDGVLLPFYLSILLCCLSFVWLWLTYRKKESVVFACEE